MTENPYSVMVVDDSAVIRGLLTRALESDPDIKVVASVGDGQMALNAIQRQKVDVVVLDIEMPVMDGLTALPKLLEASPRTKIVMASTLTKRGADISLRAMQMGASEYIPKPSTTRDIHSADSFKQELISKVKSLGAAASGDKRASASAPYRVGTASAAPRPGSGSAAGARAGAAPSTPASTRSALAPLKPAAEIKLRPMPSAFRPEIIAIGSSTGGPQALFGVIKHLADTKLPIVITQHMPATFTAILAEHIGRQCKIESAEAKHGEPITAGRVFLAPGDNHMLIEKGGAGPTVKLTQDPPENFCRPAVDPMMRSLVRTYGRNVLAVILTGMGQDGMKGCTDVAQAGGVVLAQDEASSVVWGMPGAVANAGICNAVLPLKDIGEQIRKLTLRSAA